jgi:hypothetical protein
MPESIIKKVEQFGKSNTRPNPLDFADRNRILFVWNNDINKYPEGLVKEDMVLYLSLAAEIPGVVLERDLPIPTIGDKIEPQGHAKDTVAWNTNLEPFDIPGVDAMTIICANNNEIEVINDNNEGILSIATIPANKHYDPLILPNTSDSDTLDDEDQSKDKKKDKDNLSNDNLDGQEADKQEEGLTDDQDEGVHRSKHNNKGMTAKYTDYGLMINARQTKGGQSCQIQATICNGLMFFLEEDLSNAKPIPEDNRLEWALGAALVHYSMKAGIKKFQDSGEAGVSKELTQIDNM